MHMADALVAPAVAATMYITSGVTAGYSVRKIRFEQETKKIPMMGIMGAFVFSAQMINFTIPGTGSSGHLAGGMLLTALLGPEAAFLTLVAILTTQCLMFADGGLLALGCNIWNMGFYGCILGGYLIWRPMIRSGITKKKILIASILGSVLTLQLGAFSVVAETTISGITEIPFTAFLLVMQPIHLAIGLVEGLITAAVLSFVYEARPELFWAQTSENAPKKQRISLKWTMIALAAFAAVTAAVISRFASADPDGLEWSLGKLGRSVTSPDSFWYQIAHKIQSVTALFPDYSHASVSDGAGTSISGIVGGAIVLFVCIAAGHLIRYVKRKQLNESNRTSHTGNS